MINKIHLKKSMKLIMMENKKNIYMYNMENKKNIYMYNIIIFLLSSLCL